MTEDAGRPPRRRRNSVLAALELFRALGLPRGFNAMILFLYVCENEGANVSEIAQVAGMEVPGVARLIKVMAGLVPEEPIPTDSILFDLRGFDRDRRVRFVHLTERGRSVRDTLEQLIADASPIGGKELKVLDEAGHGRRSARATP